MRLRPEKPSMTTRRPTQNWYLLLRKMENPYLRSTEVLYGVTIKGVAASSTCTTSALCTGKWLGNTEYCFVYLKINCMHSARGVIFEVIKANELRKTSGQWPLGRRNAPNLRCDKDGCSRTLTAVLESQVVGTSHFQQFASPCRAWIF
jgi:hypothetical protein